MGPQGMLWLGWLVAVLWFGSCLMVLLWALLGERGLKARRCPRCWHDLSGIAGMTCSECGFRARGEKQLHSRRPRRIPAYAALAAATAGTLFIHDRLNASGWRGLVPDRALTLCSWCMPESLLGKNALDEISKRAMAGTLSDSALLELIEQAAAACPDGIDEAWRDRYGLTLSAAAARAWRAQQSGFVDPKLDPLIDALKRVPPRIEVDVPSKWMAEDPLVIQLSIDCYWVDPPGFRARAMWVDGPPPQHASNGTTDDSGFTGWVLRQGPRGTGSANLPLALLPLGTNRGSVIVEVDDLSRVGSDTVVRVAEATVEVTARGQIEPVSGRRFDAAVSSVFSDGMLLWKAAPGRAAFSLNTEATALPEFSGILFGVDVQACDEAGVPRRSLRAWWVGGTGTPSPPRWEIAREDKEALIHMPPDGAAWTLRIKSNPVVASRSANSLEELPLRVWSGELVLPLTVTPQEGTPLPRPWALESDQFQPARK